MRSSIQLVVSALLVGSGFALPNYNEVRTTSCTKTQTTSAASVPSYPLIPPHLGSYSPESGVDSYYDSEDLLTETNYYGYNAADDSTGGGYGYAPVPHVPIYDVKPIPITTSCTKTQDVKPTASTSTTSCTKTQTVKPIPITTSCTKTQDVKPTATTSTTSCTKTQTVKPIPITTSCTKTQDVKPTTITSTTSCIKTQDVKPTTITSTTLPPVSTPIHYPPHDIPPSPPVHNAKSNPVYPPAPPTQDYSYGYSPAPPSPVEEVKNNVVSPHPLPPAPAPAPAPHPASSSYGYTPVPPLNSESQHVTPPPATFEDVKNNAITPPTTPPYPHHPVPATGYSYIPAPPLSSDVKSAHGIPPTNVLPAKSDFLNTFNSANSAGSHQEILSESETNDLPPTKSHRKRRCRPKFRK